MSKEAEKTQEVETVVKEVAEPVEKPKADEKARTEFAKQVAGSVVDGLAPSFKELTNAILKTKEPAPVEKPVETPKVEETEKSMLSKEDVEKMIADRLSGDVRSDHAVSGVLKLARFEEGSKDQIRVKKTTERFDDTKSTLTYTKGLWKDRPVVYAGETRETQSDLDRALFAAWAKFQAVGHIPSMFSDHDRDLINHILETKKFVNCDYGSTIPRKLTDSEIAEWRKAMHFGWKVPLIDDSTSGGQNAVPEFFDFNAILVPTLTSELMPWVTIVDVPRGSSADTYQVGTFTVTKTAEGSAATAFDATSLVANHDTSFFYSQIIVDVGRGFMQDSAPAMATQLQTQMLRAKQADFDESVINGDGTTEPTGILNAASTVAVTSVNGTGGPVHLTDLVNLRFGVNKAHHQMFDLARARYVMTETTYKRHKSLSTGVSGDDRLLHGMNMDTYELLGHGVSIPNAGMTNSDVVYCQLGGYRWYRRQGVTFSSDDTGRTNQLAHQMQLIVRSREGGQLDRGSYAAVCSNSQS